MMMKQDSSFQTDRIPKGCAKFGIGEWDHIAYGNHRAVIRVAEAGEAVCAYLPWRRRDLHPAAKHVLVVSAQSGKTVGNSVAAACNREYGEIVFEPVEGPGLYYAYYFVPARDPHAYTWPRSAFPITRYMAPRPPTSVEWAARHNLTPDQIEIIPRADIDWDGMPPESDDPIPKLRKDGKVYPAAWRALPQAELVEFQSRSEWDSFYPMEVIATVNERLALEQRCRSRPFILVPENRRRPIRMTDTIPYAWAARPDDELAVLRDEACRNEYFVFQVGLYAHHETLADITASSSDLTAGRGTRIPARAITCFNLEGVDQLGARFKKRLHVPHAKVQALWFGVDVPAKTVPGMYRGTVTISAAGLPPQSVGIELVVSKRVLADRGDGDHWRHSRLRWLNSILAHDDKSYAPYVPLKVQGRTIDLLGRTITLGAGGLPASLRSSIDMFEITARPREILAAPVTMEMTVAGKTGPVPMGDARRWAASAGIARFAGAQKSAAMAVLHSTAVELDGMIEHRLAIRPAKDLAIDDLRLSIHVAADVARYFTTPNPIPEREKAQGGACPARYECPIADFEAVWVGDYNAGVGLRLPAGNNGWKRFGGARAFVLKDAGGCAIELHLGPAVLPAGAEAVFITEFYVTPFKPLTKAHWAWRYYHTGQKVDVPTGKGAGALVYTQHHGVPSNPYINYPILTADRLREIGDAVHKEDGLFKFYYTIRELSVRATELWVLRSLGAEILVSSVGRLGAETLAELPLEYQQRNPYHEPFTGMPWCCEHLGDDYHTRWHTPGGGTVEDADGSLQISGASRWSNFYIESLVWLMRNAGLDGLYLDGVTFDRTSLRRVRKTMLREKPRMLIDWHGGPSSIELLPFCDSIWNGEGALSEREPDYWLAVISGIAFGTPGELLLPQSSVARGMVYGLSQRYGWMALEQVDPSGLWNWWDDFDIAGAEMIGYWQANCPVATGHPMVKATAYVHRGKRMAVAVASWAVELVTVKLAIDWDSVGLDPVRASARIPEIPKFQPATECRLDALPVAPDKGWLIEIAR